MDLDPDDLSAADSALTSIPTQQDNQDVRGDVYSAMLGGKYDPNQIAQNLSAESTLGQILQLTGNPAVAPAGQSMSDQADQQLGGLARTRQAMAALQSNQALRQSQLDANANYRQDMLGERQQAETDAQQNRALQLTIAQMNAQREAQDSQARQPIPSAVDAYVSQIRSGDAPLPQGYVLSTPFGQAVAQRNADPTFQPSQPYDPELYPAKSRALENLQKDPVLPRLGAAYQHLGTLSQLSQAVDAGDSQTANRLLQGLQNEFGGAGISGYQAAVPLVANEVAAAITGARGGTEKDRDTLAQGLAAKLGGAQKATNFGVYQQLLGGQLRSRARQYNLVDPSMLSRFFPAGMDLGNGAASAGATTPSGAASAGSGAPQSAIAYLQAHPETAPLFRAKYGFLPGQSGGQQTQPAGSFPQTRAALSGASGSW